MCMLKRTCAMSFSQSEYCNFTEHVQDSSFGLALVRLVLPICSRSAPSLQA